MPQCPLPQRSTPAHVNPNILRFRDHVWGNELLIVQETNVRETNSHPRLIFKSSSQSHRDSTAMGQVSSKWAWKWSKKGWGPKLVSRSLFHSDRIKAASLENFLGSQLVATLTCAGVGGFYFAWSNLSSRKDHWLLVWARSPCHMFLVLFLPLWSLTPSPPPPIPSFSPFFLFLPANIYWAPSMLW